MNLTRKQKKLLKKQLKVLSLEQIASNLGVSEKDLLGYLKIKTPKKRYYQLVSDEMAEVVETARNFRLADFLKCNWEYLLILAFLVAGVYFNSLSNDFLSDDIATIRDNPELKNLAYVGLPTPPYFVVTRFVEHLVYSLAGLVPAYYRLVNFVFHFGATSLVFVLGGFFFGMPVSFFAASLYAVHPLLSESVLWISGMPYVLGCFFSLLATVFFLFGLAKKRWLEVITASVLLVISFASSEKTATLAFAWLVFVILSPSLRRDRKNWPFLAVYLLIGLFWAAVLSGQVGERIESLTGSYYSAGGYENPLRQIPIAIGTYLELFAAPLALTFYHSEEIQVSGWELGYKALITLSFFGLMAYCFFKQKKLFFWQVFLFVAMATTLTPLRISWIVAERYAYLGSIGLFFTAAYFLNELGKKLNRQKLTWMILIVILVLFSARTIVRGLDWRNQDYLWLATDKVSPNSHQNHNNLGDLYYRKQDYNRAIAEFQEAIRLKPNYGDAFHNMANVYHVLGNDAEAAKHYETALTFNQNIWQSHLNLAVIYYQTGRADLSLPHMEKVVELKPGEPEYRANLAGMYMGIGNNEKARSEFEKVLMADPTNEKARQGLSNLNKTPETGESGVLPSNTQ